MSRTSLYKTLATVAATVAAVALVSFIYYNHDPSSPAAPKCIFRLLTGWDCPGCGSQRALHALLHGQPARAWSFNPYIFFAVPGAVVFILVEAMRKSHPRLHRALINEATIAAVLAATVAWWIFRNL
ncbi:MAG: DUF2752 domain-containing protein [Muribaculaceae bacterium]|nr:DUF2752 domain-containing protein [Muribaculaceae bacterium]